MLYENNYLETGPLLSVKLMHESGTREILNAS
jgi:hypothetical protein